MLYLAGLFFCTAFTPFGIRLFHPEQPVETKMRSMDTAQLVALRDVIPDPGGRMRTDALPLGASRAALEVALTGPTPEASRANLATLLRSPLGVYVIHTEVLRDSVQVRFDIAPEDLAFTMHTLLATLPEATIGAVQYHECGGAH
jgi:hypothetical protein